jgi:hypothetical protein
MLLRYITHCFLGAIFTKMVRLRMGLNLWLIPLLIVPDSCFWGVKLFVALVVY